MELKSRISLSHLSVKLFTELLETKRGKKCFSGFLYMLYKFYTFCTAVILKLLWNIVIGLSPCVINVMFKIRSITEADC